MIDEINYFPKRDNFQKKKKIDDDWKELKKQKTQQDARKKSPPAKSKDSTKKKDWSTLPAPSPFPSAEFILSLSKDSGQAISAQGDKIPLIPILPPPPGGCLPR